ncbi:MAG: apolipoprotein N-acyltransferase [Planctomycetota bacterium]
MRLTATARRDALLGLIAGAIYAVCTLLALPPVSFWFVALAAPLPLALLGWRADRARWKALGAATGSLPLWVVHHAWMADVTLAGVGPLVIYLACWTGASVWVLSRVSRVGPWMPPVIGVPTAWVGLEFLRGEVAFEGYAWFLAGHPMIESSAASRAAGIGGVYFVSWLVVLVSGIVVTRRVGSPAHRRTAVAASVGLVALLAAGVLAPTGGPGAKSIRVAALQTDVPQSNKIAPMREQLVDDLRALLSLAEEGAAGGAQLLVTPETVLPLGVLDPEALAVIESVYGPGAEPFGDALRAGQRSLGVPMLVGCTTPAGLQLEDDGLMPAAVYNSVYLLVGGEPIGPRYDKLRPTPFGETLPYIQSLPWLRDVVIRIGLGATGMDFGLARGTRPVTFEVPTTDGPVAVSTPICFESSMAPTVRRLVLAARDAGTPTELLCVVTNDGWFGSFDAGREMHLLQARWRCVEHGLPMIRAANTGVSAVIDGRGRIVTRLDPRQPGVLIGDIRLGSTTTIYQTIGDSFGIVCVTATLGAVAWAGFAALRRRRSEQRDAGQHAGEEPGS